MSEPNTPSAKQKIQLLRDKFVQQLPHRMKQIDAAWADLQSDSGNSAAITELHRAVHNINGTGRSFGFRQLGTAGDDIEILLSRCINTDNDESCADKLEQLATLLQTFKQDVAAIAATAERADDTCTSAKLSSVEPSINTNTEPASLLLYLCDDDQLVNEHLSLQLKYFGYQVVHFTELEQLNRAMRERCPDALIMDIGFPEGCHAGTAMVKELRTKMNSNLPVVFLSGYDNFDARLSAVLAGGTEYFTKPANVQELVDTLDRITNRYPPEPYRILIVDDEPTVAEYHSIILQKAGMATRCLSDPRAILNVLQEFRADLILMDMYMPGCSGYDLAKLVRQVTQYESMPIIYLSIEVNKQKQLCAMRIGAEGFMCKPVDHNELVGLVEIRAERMRLLKRFMVRDSMTGLYNHTTTNQLLESALILAADNGNTSLCFVMIDIDHFKLVNDRYGHPIGDQVIIALAQVLKQRLRGADIIGRYGGEEFALVLKDVDQEKAACIINELREAFAQLHFHANNNRFSCTISAGIASFPKYRTLEALREAADTALYSAKNKGRNQIDIA